MKEFFELNKPYKFEYNDIRAVLTLTNVILVMAFGLSISWFGLIISAIGIIKDLAKDRRINNLLMHSSTLIMNIYFLILLYGG